MRSQLRVLAITLVAMAQLSGNSLASSENDAGTGADASDAIDHPTLLVPAGSYGGFLHLGDADWYASDAPSASIACLVFTTTTDRSLPMTTTLGGRTLRGFTAPSGSAIMALAAGTTTALPIAGLTDSGSLSAPTSYSFTLRAIAPTDLPPGDGGSGADAGDSLSTAAPLSAPCTGGTIGGSDTTDVYAFFVNGGNPFAVSLASTGGAAVSARVVGNDGTAMATVGSDGFVSVKPLLTGTYYIIVQTSSSGVSGPTAYLLATTGVSGPNDPCRPNCVVST